MYLDRRLHTSQLTPATNRLVPLASCLLALLVSGCHSAYIDSTLTNATPQPISLLQIDYPSASFGDQVLSPGNSFHYRFKILGNGPLKLTYTDAAQHEHTSSGPILHEGDEGTLTILVTAKEVRWIAPTHTSH